MLSMMLMLFMVLILMYRLLQLLGIRLVCVWGQLLCVCVSTCVCVVN